MLSLLRDTLLLKADRYTITRRKRSMNGRSSGGFTLVELLVVIVIIAILCAILFPIFINAKERASIVNCTSNVRQIGMALIMFVDDNDGKFPSTYDAHALGGADGLANQEIAKNPVVPFPPGYPSGTAVGGNGAASTRPLNPYVKSLEVWHCKHEKDWTGGTAVGGKKLGPDFKTEGTSYLWNAKYLFVDYGTHFVEYRPLINRPLNTIKNAPQQITFAERGLHEWFRRPIELPMGYRNHDRAKCTTVVAFVDGHAAYITMNFGLWDGYPTTPLDRAKWIIAPPGSNIW